MANKKLMLEDRKNGMKISEIAKKHGVSRQYACNVCSQHNHKCFREVTETGCVYPNWRKWMNENKISRNDLLRMMGDLVNGTNSSYLSCYMRGIKHPKKAYIDKLLSATGMTYEKLFALEDNDAK